MMRMLIQTSGTDVPSESHFSCLSKQLTEPQQLHLRTVLRYRPTNDRPKRLQRPGNRRHRQRQSHSEIRHQHAHHGLAKHRWVAWTWRLMPCMQESMT